MRSAEYRKDTHEKIKLGGLVIKAGLRNADKALILGALVYVASLQKTSDNYGKLLALGRDAMKKEALDEIPEERKTGHSRSAFYGAI